MNKYEKGKIYAIINDNNMMYIGSTCMTLNGRLSRHKNDKKRWQKGKYNYVSSFEVIDNTSRIILLEEYKCKNKRELCEREKYHIINNECINIRIPDRYNIDEEDKKIYNMLYRKQYYKDNKVKFEQYYKQYKSYKRYHVLFNELGHLIDLVDDNHQNYVIE